MILDFYIGMLGIFTSLDFQTSKTPKVPRTAKDPDIKWEESPPRSHPPKWWRGKSRRGLWPEQRGEWGGVELSTSSVLFDLIGIYGESYIS